MKRSGATTSWQHQRDPKDYSIAPNSKPYPFVSRPYSAIWLENSLWLFHFDFVTSCHPFSLFRVAVTLLSSGSATAGRGGPCETTDGRSISCPLILFPFVCKIRSCWAACGKTETWMLEILGPIFVRWTFASHGWQRTSGQVPSRWNDQSCHDWRFETAWQRMLRPADDGVQPLVLSPWWS